MASIISELESSGAVLPDFKRSNLEVARQLGRWKGEFIGDRKKKVFLIIDGFGHNIIQNVMKKYKIKSELFDNSRIEKITTIFPSTTVNVLTSLHTGLTTAEHGVPGTTVLVSEIGQLVRLFGWTSPMQTSPRSKLSNLDPYMIFPQPYVSNELSTAHKAVYLYREPLVNGEITNAMVTKADKIPYVTFEDMLILLSRLIKEDAHEFIYVYYDVADHMEHLYSLYSDEFLHLIHSMMLSFDRILLPALKEKGYDLIITADHGHITLEKDSIVRLTSESKIMEFLNMPPWNEGRVRILSAIPGKEGQLTDFFEKNYGDKAWLFETEEVIRSGILGKKDVAAGKRSRFGSHILISKGNTYFHYEYPGQNIPFGKRFGHHGGLSKDEMEVPLILY